MPALLNEIGPLMRITSALPKDLDLILLRTRKGKVQWTLPTDMKGDPLNTLRGIDVEHEVGFYMSSDPDDTADGGPSISLYGYDPEDDEMEMTPDEMFLAGYGTPEEQALLKELIQAALVAAKS